LVERDSNFIDLGFASGEAGLHEAQKPVVLLQALIELCTPEKAMILDPFAGSGSTGVAAQRANRKYLLVEQNSDFVETIHQRLNSPKL
jgi:site-specific DNA-methyltransferase (adenine-specific)